jgi:DNA-binding XRE family transcriptional regulator
MTKLPGVTTPTTRREELGWTQTDAATLAEVSVDSWRQWEADPASVSSEIQHKCEDVLQTEEATRMRIERAAVFHREWKECSYLTPRQASAIATGLAVWSYSIDLWIHGESELPLHEVGPFEAIDRRVMMYVNENKAWAAKAQERCDAVAGEIERGVLPFDRDACFFDELLIGAALRQAMAILDAMPDIFDEIPARVRSSEHNDDERQVFDDNWDAVEDAFAERCQWGVWQVPLYQDHPVLAELLAELHPFAWFDSPQPFDDGQPEDPPSNGPAAVEPDEPMSSVPSN